MFCLCSTECRAEKGFVNRCILFDAAALSSRGSKVSSNTITRRLNRAVEVRETRASCRLNRKGAVLM